MENPKFQPQQTYCGFLGRSVIIVFSFLSLGILFPLGRNLALICLHLYLFLLAGASSFPLPNFILLQKAVIHMLL